MSPIATNQAPIRVGDYWVNQRTGVMIEILEVDLSGNAIVNDVSRPDDKPEPQRFMASKFSSALWKRLDRAKPAEAA